MLVWLIEDAIDKQRHFVDAGWSFVTPPRVADFASVYIFSHVCFLAPGDSGEKKH
jgi:hypothetical protein